MKKVKIAKLSENTGFYSNLTSIPKEFEIIMYSSLEEILKEYYKGDVGDEVLTFWGKDGECKMHVSNFIENTTAYGVWGFCNNKKAIHMWYDKKTVNDIDLIRFLCHELSHMQRPFHKDRVAEEMKAENYADIGIAAFSLLKCLKRMK